MTPDPADITELLSAARGGDRDALDSVFHRVYDELRRLADIQLRRVGRDQTLGTTAIVHEAYLKLFFPDVALATFDTPEDAQKALKSGAIDFVFGDGIGLTFWINGMTSDGCCEFRGGPYLDNKFFGEGVGIAVKKGNRQMAEILSYALEQVHASGRYEELFLRYFPMSFF